MVTQVRIFKEMQKFLRGRAISPPNRCIGTTERTRINKDGAGFARSGDRAYNNRLLLAPIAGPEHIHPMLPDEQPGSDQIAALRAMSGQERLKVAERLYWSARKMKAAGVRAQHPDWPEAQVETEVRRIFINARG